MSLLLVGQIMGYRHLGLMGCIQCVAEQRQDEADGPEKHKNGLEPDVKYLELPYRWPEIRRHAVAKHQPEMRLRDIKPVVAARTELRTAAKGASLRSGSLASHGVFCFYKNND
jgi:hypothetical protein